MLFSTLKNNMCLCVLFVVIMSTLTACGSSDDAQKTQAKNSENGSVAFQIVLAGRDGNATQRQSKAFSNCHDINTVTVIILDGNQTIAEESWNCADSDRKGTIDGLSPGIISIMVQGVYVDADGGRTVFYQGRTSEAILIRAGETTEVDPIECQLVTSAPAGDADQDGDGFTPNQNDCDDTDGAINPDAADECGDGIDQDCNPALCSIELPRLVDLTQAEAESEIRRIEMIVGAITRECSDTVPSGTVMGQDPISGTEVKYGAEINLVVSLGIDSAECQGKRDSDGDNINDDKDLCPETQSGETVDEVGCALYQKDTDVDGVKDNKDLCPETQSGETVDEVGCALYQKDADGDGVMDDKDTCSETQSGETVDEVGCAPYQKDTDGDNVSDADDDCPGTVPGDSADAQGCSDLQIDSDVDGVRDRTDKCPDTPTWEMARLTGCSQTQKYTDWLVLAAGKSHSMELKPDGTLWGWGQNVGQLGYFNGMREIPENEAYRIPGQVGKDNDWSDVAAGGDFTLGLKKDGTLYAWGRNEYGQLGINSTSMSFYPAQVGTDDDWVDMACGRYHSVAIKADGSLYAWGLNNYGQLGDGTTTTQWHVPVRVGLDKDWLYVAAGDEHTLAIKKDGSLYAWGRNNKGQLGDGSTTTKRVPTLIDDESDWVFISAGDYQSFAINSQGLLYAWGDNEAGQLGDGTTTVITTPKHINGVLGWVFINSGDEHTVGVTSSGAYYAWGRNSRYQHGDDSTGNKLTPTYISSGNWSSVIAGTSHTLASTKDGDVFAWGYNSYGQIGHGVSGFLKYEPIRVGIDSDWSVAVAGYNHCLAMKTNGTIYSWGANEYGQLGDGTYLDRDEPGIIGLESDWKYLSAGYYHNFGIKSDGTLYAWGANDYGQLGTGTGAPDQEPLPVKVGTDSDWLNVTAGLSHSLGRKGDSIWGGYTWGRNMLGVLGDGTDEDKYVPTHIDKYYWSYVDAGYAHNVVLTQDGSIDVWGNNYSGQLGDGTNSDGNSSHYSNEPFIVDNGITWDSVSAGGYHTIGIDLNGNYYAWGSNGFGQLGDGTIQDKNQPTLISTGHDWLVIEAGYCQSYGIDINGYLYAWGRNHVGQLGNNDLGTIEAPVQVGSDNGWISVSSGGGHAVALKADGSMYTWGDNDHGQIGDGTLFQKIPVQIDENP